MKIPEGLYKEIVNMIPAVPPETGGILGERNGVICAIVFDEGDVQNERYAYVPNVDRLNTVITQWETEGIRFAGMFHSHPGRQERLSIADRVYIRKIMEVMSEGVCSMHFPIVLPGKKMIGHIAKKVDGKVIVNWESIIVEKENHDERNGEC